MFFKLLPITQSNLPLVEVLWDKWKKFCALNVGKSQINQSHIIKVGVYFSYGFSTSFNYRYGISFL
jgi:hypothetical protein